MIQKKCVISHYKITNVTEGAYSFLLLFASIATMIDKELLTKTVEAAIDGTDNFLVDVKVSRDNNITVEIDNPEGVDIATCAEITRKIEAVFDRDEEDYELEVGSAGLTSPFKVKGQYEKNIGNEIDVLTRDGKKFHGCLTAVSEDGSEFTVEVEEKVKEPGKKRPVVVGVPRTVKVADTKSVTYRIDFK